MQQYVLEFYSKGQCSPCVATSFALQVVEWPLNVSLVNCKLEVLGEDFFRSAGVRQTPTLVLKRVNDEGQQIEIKRLVGRASADDISRLLESA
ncbi:thioredoxin [Listeria floridensis FSL S10-1187]|uniref:Thioredoxin n=1 Tax=Listeria floridensis FSL S10-1187 TaxID=1265817 RepID=A0ABP3ATN6_9LIST|nr:hypothetical protein [Listeria floridensis]EUJ25248.1 thioredoxin [Listeria floridensis FSL S10-1187]